MQHIETAPAAKKPWFRQLYFWVIVAIILGIALGALAPDLAKSMEPIGTTFVAAMRMLIGPIIFLTIVGGIASVADLRKVGMTGLKSLLYFQGGTIVALAFGMIAINLFPLGEGVNANVAALQPNDKAAKLIASGEEQHWWTFLTHIVPESFVSPFVDVNILQIIFLAVLFAIALNMTGEIGRPVLAGIEKLTSVFFKMLNILMKAAPVGAFGAMAYAVGAYGVNTLSSLGSLVLLFYVTSALFVVIVLGGIMALLRLNIFHMFRYLKEEYLIIVATSTAEPALPGLIRKTEKAGVREETVGLVVPTGYSFNLDGAAIYLSLAAVYIAQATNTHLSIGQQLGMLAVMLLTSKGAAGVAGGGFIALTATLSTVGHIPAAGIMLIFGIDKFMSECRALVNFTGNAVATYVIAAWDGTLDRAQARAVMAGRAPREAIPAGSESASDAGVDDAVGATSSGSTHAAPSLLPRDTLAVRPAVPASGPGVLS